MRSLKDYIDDTTGNCKLTDKQESAILSAFELYIIDLEREQKCTIPVVSSLIPLMEDIKIALKDGIKTRTYQKRYDISCDFPQEKVDNMIDEIIEELCGSVSNDN